MTAGSAHGTKQPGYSDPAEGACLKLPGARAHGKAPSDTGWRTVTPLGDVQVVDLCTVTAPELDDLWQYEVRLWHDRLLWDVSGAFAALRRIVGRGGLPGKAVRVHDRTVGYTYYGIDGHLGVIAGLVVLPDWSRSDVGETLLKNTIMRCNGRGCHASKAVSICRLSLAWGGA